MRTKQSLFILILIVSFMVAIHAMAQSTVEERLTALERKVAELESQLNSLTQPAPGIQVPLRTNIAHDPITLQLMRKSYVPSDFNNGRYEDQITLEFALTNNLTKPVRAFTGIVIFQDLFERDIMHVNLTVEKTVAPGENVTWSGGIEYNQFINEHQRLRSISQQDLVVKFQITSVIYTDGTRESFESLPQ